jgi:hypothetical protein
MTRYTPPSWCLFIVLGCGSAPGQQRPEAASPSASAPDRAESPSGKHERAHELVIAAVACWSGGLWSDAEGVAREKRAADAERRCHEFVTRVYGTDDSVRYERIRGLERVELAEVKARILAVAANDSESATRREHLGHFFDAVAEAEREALLLRRAGERVKKDITGDRLQTKLTTDQRAAVAPLREARAFRALLHGDFGEFTGEARAIAILNAMARMETARGLTKHLKVIALDAPFAALFAVVAPSVPDNVLEPMKAGTWLAYITSVATAAGHPVPARVAALPDRERLAWGGALAGLADQLRADGADIGYGTDLKRIVGEVVERIDTEYRATVAAVLREPGAVAQPMSRQ